MWLKIENGWHYHQAGLSRCSRCIVTFYHIFELLKNISMWLKIENGFIRSWDPDLLYPDQMVHSTQAEAPTQHQVLQVMKRSTQVMSVKIVLPLAGALLCFLLIPLLSNSRCQCPRCRYTGECGELAGTLPCFLLIPFLSNSRCKCPQC